MNNVPFRCGLDIAKQIFAVHAVSSNEKPVFQKLIPRRKKQKQSEFELLSLS